MSTDHELLALAARAVGELYTEPFGDGVLLANGEDWNPLTDNGDALRLLAELPSLWSLGLKFGSPSIVMDLAWGFKGIKVTKFNGQNTDRAEVIRRAIVEAAAEIGRSM